MGKVRKIYFQGPSKGIADPKAFKRALTKRYQEERRTWGGKGPIQVLYGGRSWNQADQLISEWASQGFKKFLRPKKLHEDFKTNKLYNKKYGDLLFQVNKKGMPIIEKEPINISKLDSPDKSIEKISFSRQGKIVYPGKDTKPHFERFDQLLAQKGNKLKPAFEAFLDEIEDIGKGTTKQKPDIPELRKAKVGGGTKLPMLDRGQGSVTKQAPDIKSMLAGIQVAEEKARYYKLDDFTLDRIKSIQKSVAYPLEAGESIETSVADSPEIEFIDNKLESYSQDQGSLGEYKGRGRAGGEEKITSKESQNIGSNEAIVSKTDELKAETSIKVDDEEVTLLSDLDEGVKNLEDQGISKEIKQYEKLKSIQATVGPKRWGKLMESPESRRIFMNYISDVLKKGTDTVFRITSSNPDIQKGQAGETITGPNKKGKWIKADSVTWGEKQYIARDRNKVKKIKEGIASDRKDAKIARVNTKIADLRRSDERAVASIRKYLNKTKTQLSPSSKPSLSTTTSHNFLNWLRSTQEAKKKHAEAIRGNIYKRVKDKKVTTAITKYHKPISKKTGIKAIEDKLKVTAKKKALPQDPKTTSKVTQELQKKFHGKDKPRYKSTVGKGLKFTRGIGALSLFSSIFGVARARKELKSAGVKDPSVLETMYQTFIPESNWSLRYNENLRKERKKLARAI